MEMRQQGRRKFLVAGGSLIAGGTALPAQWKQPVIQSIILPAHAATSDVIPPGGEPIPEPNPACNPGVAGNFAVNCHGMNGANVTWSIGSQGDVCCVAVVGGDCPGVCAISTRTQVILTGTGFTNGMVVTAHWDNAKNAPSDTVSGGTFEVDAGNFHQGCDTLHLLELSPTEQELCSLTFFGVATGPCVADCP